MFALSLPDTRAAGRVDHVFAVFGDDGATLRNYSSFSCPDLRVTTDKQRAAGDTRATGTCCSKSVSTANITARLLAACSNLRRRPYAVARLGSYRTLPPYSVLPPSPTSLSERSWWREHAHEH